jgi:hypothetical protein
MLSCAVVIGAIVTLLLAGGEQHAAADEKGKAAQKSEPGVSFAVYGDSRR